jgi:hypothetical protein
MRVQSALDQLDQIHEQLTKSEVYRGFRVPALALVGTLAFVAALGQKYVLNDATLNGFVTYWVAVAGICGLLGTATAVQLYATREDDFARRRTRKVLAQFSPCVIAGAIVTIAVVRVPQFGAFLPGLWGTIFGLGMIAACPYLPYGTGLVGLCYVAAGSTLILRTSPNEDPSVWAVGFVFGVGHLMTALALWREKGESDGGS